MKTLQTMMLALLPALGAMGCTAAPDDGDTDCTGDKCDDADEIQTTLCDSKFVDMSGRAKKVKPGQLNDAFAKAIFKAGEGCPMSYEDVLEKLRETDKAGCDSGAGAGLVTRLVSERSQTLGTPDSYRAVVTRRCDGRQEHEMVFSLFGLTPDGGLPEDVEVVAFDKARGVFNFYVNEGGKWNFHGDSIDMLEGPQEEGKRRCAGCHPAGGLVMKELESPWVHWEGDTTTPGAADFVTKHANALGRKGTGIDLESVVRSGNDAWQGKRLENLKKAGLKEVLKPLFCTVEINLRSGTSSASPVSNDSGGSELSRVPGDFLVDQEGFGTFESVPVDAADYRAQVTANGQKIASGGRQLRDKDGKPAMDTVFDFTFPKRAIVDSEYVQKLIADGIIDEDFAKDVLLVDFTRPIFSTDRCELLELAPDLAEADMKADKVREGFLSALGSPAAGTPEADLKANLSSTDEVAEGRLAAFFTACKARPKKDFLADAMKINSLRRNQTRELQVMEFEESLPSDTLSVNASSRLDPKTCQVTTSFVGF